MNTESQLEKREKTRDATLPTSIFRTRVSEGSHSKAPACLAVSYGGIALG